MLNSIGDIIELHKHKGNIEDAYINIPFDNKTLKLNTYTLKFVTVNSEKNETKNWNNILNFEIRKNRNLHKEISEFRILFEAFNKLKIQSGYVLKSESPDFVLERNNKKTGIEITKIYSGNDWVVEKLIDDIKTYSISNKEIDGYIKYKKYTNKIKTYRINGNLVIKPVNKIEDESKLKVKMKNKIFEKIRKMFDDYNNYDNNVILAEIVNSKYLDIIDNLKDFNDELTFYINHLEKEFNEMEYLLLIKIDEAWIKFDLKRHIFTKL